MQIINLTPHSISIYLENGEVLKVDPTGEQARVASIPGKDMPSFAMSDEVKVPLQTSKSFGDVEGLPDPQPRTIYVVSGLVASRLKDRPDVFSPDTGRDAIRDEKGRIQGVRRLIQSPQG